MLFSDAFYIIQGKVSAMAQSMVYDRFRNSGDKVLYNGALAVLLVKREGVGGVGRVISQDRLGNVEYQIGRARKGRSPPDLGFGMPIETH